MAQRTKGTNHSRCSQIAGRSRDLVLVACVLCCAAAGCSSAGADDECRTGADCPSGACHNGACVPDDSTTDGGAAGGPAPGGAGQGGTDGGGGSSVQGGAGGGGNSNSCVPNDDGTIAQSEIPLKAGLSAKFLVSLDATVSTAGTDQPDGSRIWDFSTTSPSDETTLIDMQSLTGKWFESLFPGADYAARLSSTEELLGVFEIATDALLLRGVVSPDDGLLRTELVYDPPATVLAFPLQEGKSWQSSSKVTGWVSGVHTTPFYTEDYTYQVDAHGVAKTPFGDFNVLRTRVLLERTINFIPSTIRSYLFTTECFGTVATATSQKNEPNLEFNDIAELRRLTP